MTMEMALGMSEEEVNGIFFRGTDQGTQMKADYGWPNGGNGTNSSGFTGLPGGYRYGPSGNFYGASYAFGRWWTSTRDDSNAWYRALNDDRESVGRNAADLRNGYSVRCVRDAE